jgi:GNAT superfamily N-acetyltransferase
VFARTSIEGWRGLIDFEDLMMDLMQVTAARADMVPFLAESGGAAIASGALCLHGGVALLAGACTVPEFRKRGAQNALLAARLRYAAGAGCELAMMCAEPGSASQRNAERNGFRIAYTRVKWAAECPK